MISNNLELAIMNIALITPTSLESGELKNQIKPAPSPEKKKISRGELHGRSVVFTQSGVGKVNAAHSTTLLLEEHDIDMLILFGIGGAYCNAIPGDVVVAETENYGEEGVMTPDGWKSMEYTGFPLLKKESECEYFNTFPLDMDLVRFVLSILKYKEFNVTSGNFVTVSQCSCTKTAGNTLMKRFNGICENMEGAAVAHICALYNLPLIEIRGISNIVEERYPGSWNIPLAVTNCNKCVSEIVKRSSEIIKVSET